MEYINKLEKMVAGWYAGVPHLSPSGRKWLSTNVWWIALIGVILGAMGILTVISVTFFAGVLASVYAGPVGAALAGVGLFVVVIALVISIASLVLTAMAVAPLKALKKRGWTLLFLTVLLHVASQVLDFLFSFNLLGLVWSLLFTAIGAYFLFEIRDSFAVQVKPAKAPVKKTV